MSGSSFAFRLAMTLSGILVMACCVVAALNYLKFEKLLAAQQARVLMVTTQDVSDTFERSINLGVRLMGVPGAQALLDARWSSDRTIRRLSVVDTTGIILFDTDRAALSQAAPEPLLRAAADVSTRVTAMDLTWIAAPIVNNFGQTEGTLLLAYDMSGARARLGAIALEIVRPTAAMLAVAIPLATVLAFVITRPARQRFHALERAMLGLPATSEEPAAAAAVRASVAMAERTMEVAERDLEAAAALRGDERAA